MYISIDISNNNILSQKKDKNPDDCVDLISVNFTIMRAKGNKQSPKKLGLTNHNCPVHPHSSTHSQIECTFFTSLNASSSQSLIRL